MSMKINFNASAAVSAVKRVAQRIPGKKVLKYTGLTAGYGLGLASLFSGVGVPLLLVTGTAHALSKLPAKKLSSLSDESKEKILVSLPYAFGGALTLGAAVGSPFFLLPAVASFGYGMAKHFTRVKAFNRSMANLNAEKVSWVHIGAPYEIDTHRDNRLFRVPVSGNDLRGLNHDADIYYNNSGPDHVSLEIDKEEPCLFTGDIAIGWSISDDIKSIRINLFSNRIPGLKKASLTFDPGLPLDERPLLERIKKSPMNALYDLIDKLIKEEIPLPQTESELKELRLAIETQDLSLEKMEGPHDPQPINDLLMMIDAELSGL